MVAQWYHGQMVERVKRKPNVACLVCKMLVYRRPIQIERNRGRVFCGQSCFGKFSRRESPCMSCGKAILAGQNKRTCSRACANKARFGSRYGTGRLRDNVRDQRTIKLHLIREKGGRCARCDFNRVEILHVHHRDRNRKNNTNENLELLCPNCHATEHYLEIAGSVVM